MTDPLADFLLARIAEDEAVANCGGSSLLVFAECRAKRGIVAMDDSREVRSPDYWDAVYEAMAHLATVYDDHPDYQQDWRP